jgi:hypothetical protein
LNKGEWRPNLTGHCFVGRCDNCKEVTLLVGAASFKRLENLPDEKWVVPAKTELEPVDVGQTLPHDPKPEVTKKRKPASVLDL